MKSFRLISVGLFILALSNVAFSEEVKAEQPPSTASQQTDSVAPVPPEGDVDSVLTNANLRASSGSKSRWSLANSITYDGGALSSPLAESRPNIAGASATSSDTDLNDTIRVKLALDTFDSLFFGVGVRKMAPFTGSGPSAAFYAAGGKDVDVFDPALSYQRIYKYWGIQAVSQVNFTQYTRQDIHSAAGGNLNEYLGFDQENIYEIGRFSIGASTGVGTNLPTDWGVNYSEFQFWFDPYVEFKINEVFNLRTVASLLNFEYYPLTHLTQDAYVESAGVGISITRDIFLYPNVNFAPEHLTLARTNFGVTATINLF